jgi:hypothetical protein
MLTSKLDLIRKENIRCPILEQFSNFSPKR